MAMAATLSRTPRRILSSFCYSTSTTLPVNETPEFPFPSFRAAKSAILSESNPHNLAETFIQLSQFPKFRRHRPIYHLCIRKLSRGQHFDLIQRIIETQIQHNSSSEGFWIRLILLYSNAGMLEKSMDIVDQLIQNKPCHLSEKLLCAVLSIHLNLPLPDSSKVHQLFESIPPKIALTPSIVSHNLILKAFVLQNDLPSARKWLHDLYNDSKVVPNIDSYNILLGAYYNKGDRMGFDEIVKEISNKGLDFNLTSYNYRISIMCKNKECARAKKLLDELLSKGLKPNSATYNTIVDGFCRVGDLDSATKLVEGMLRDGYVSPCSLTYYTLLRSMVKEGEFDSGLETCKEIIRRKWIPPFEAMEGLVRGLLNVSRVEEAKQIVDKMKKRLKGSALESWAKLEPTLPLPLPLPLPS